jgi:hypothetical protein
LLPTKAIVQFSTFSALGVRYFVVRSVVKKGMSAVGALYGTEKAISNLAVVIETSVCPSKSTVMKLFCAFLCCTAALCSQIALKVQNLQNFFVKLIKCENIFTAT